MFVSPILCLHQALSIRPDILSPRSMVELQKLCDKVPSYDSKIAFATMERELGKPVDEIFSSITDEPVAAASLGQVVRVTECRTQPIASTLYQLHCFALTWFRSIELLFVQLVRP